MIHLLLALTFFSTPSLARRAAPPTHEVIVKKGEKYQGVEFPPGTVVRLYPNDVLVSATLKQNFTHRGLLLLSGSVLSLHENGALFELTPVPGQKIGDLTFGQDEKASLLFSKDGPLERANLQTPKVIQGYRYAKSAEILFHPNGMVAKGIYLEAQEKDGLHLAANSTASFHENGKLKQATLDKESRFGELTIKGDPNPANPGETEFWPNGKLKNAVLAKPATIDGYPCAAGRISFFESGKLQTLILGADKKVTMNSYPKDAHAGDSLNLSEDGKVIGWSGK